MEGAPTNKIESKHDISFLTNPEIENILDDAGLIVEDVEISPNDFDAIKNRAIFLNKELTNAQTESLIIKAFVDRMENEKKLTSKIIEQIPNDTLRKVLVMSGYTSLLADEEIEMFKKSGQTTHDWVKARKEAKNAVRDFHVAVDEKTSDVISSGDTNIEALRKANEQ